MRINLRYQLILFSSFDLEANPETIKIIQSSIGSELVPTPMIEGIINALTSEQKRTTRPRFSTQDASFCFYAKSDCLVFEWVNVDIGNTKEISMDSFCKQSKDICQNVDFFANHMYRRIGLIRTTFIDEIDSQKAFFAFNNPIKYYCGKEMKDWNVFIPAKVSIANNIEVNATSRIQHVITRVNRDSINKEFNGISLTTDVNTAARPTQDIYTLADIERMMGEIKDIEYKITNETYDAVIGANN